MLCALLATCRGEVAAPNSPSALAFTRALSSTTAGAPIASVTVEARDASGKLYPGYTGAVTVAIGTNAGGGTLSGTTTVAAVGGIATFADLSIDKSGTGYALSATATGLTAANSASFNIVAGSPSQLSFLLQPQSTTAGSPLAAVTVAAQDAFGNTVTSFGSNVTVAITTGTGPGGATLSGTTVIAATAGIATFSTLSINKTGAIATGTGYTLSATTAGLAVETSDPFDITPGAATHLAFTVQPTTEAAGAHLAPPIQVSALDVGGNTVPTFTNNVTIAITSGTGRNGATLSGTKTVAASAGVATFFDLGIDSAAVGYTLTATVAGLTSATSSGFDILPGAATQLVFTVQPVSTIAGAAITPSVNVTARDAQGNVAKGFTGNVSMVIGTNPSNGNLLGTTVVAADSGVASFTNLRIDKTGVGYRLSATAAPLTPATSAAFDVVPSTASQLVFTAQPSTTVAGATFTTVQVTARDAAGNTATSFGGNVTIAIGTNPASGTLTGTLTTAAVAGVATFSDLSINKSGIGYTLTATATTLTTGTSAPFTITPGPAAVLLFTVQPSTTTAGATILPQVEVTAQDTRGNVATGFTGDVTVAIGTNPGGGVLSGTATVPAVSGVASFAGLRIDKAGSGYTLTASASGPSGATSDPFNISAAQANQLVFTTQPSGTVAGASISPTVQVTARDSVGNTVTSFAGTITLTITAGTGSAGATLSGTTAVQAVSGVATFSTLSIDKVGSGYTLSATAAGVTGSVSTPFAITPGPAAQLSFTGQPSSTAAGSSIAPPIVVTALDAHGNTATGFIGAVTVAIGTNPASGRLGGTTTVAAVSGLANFANLNIDKSGIGYTLSASATGLSGATSASFTITAGAPAVLAFTVQPSTATAGTAITPAIQVSARDQFGNPTTGFVGSVTMSIGANPGSGVLSGTATVSAVGGVATFSTLSINKSGVGYTLSATATALTTASSAPFNIGAGIATQLTFTGQPTATPTNASINPAVKVTALDAFGNIATGFSNNVTVSIGTNPTGGTLAGTRTFAAIAGTATFPNLNINTAGTGYTLTAASGGLPTATSNPFNIIASTAIELFFSVQPTNPTTAGAPFAIQVSAFDAAGQTVTSFTGNVTVAITSGTGTAGAALGGTKTVAAVGGVANFSNLTIDKSGVGYKLTVTASGLPASTSRFFTITPGPAKRLVLTVQPSTATARATITPQIEVTALDSLGNIATGFAGSVTAAIGTNPASGVLSGTATVPAAAGVASFSTLSIDQPGSGYTLTATAAGLAGATSAPFDITATLATQLVFTVQPTTATAGVNISPAVQVTARNGSGQIQTSFTGNVTLTITAGTGTSGATLLGTTTVAASNGVATFPSLNINKDGSGYRLSAVATGVSGAKSTAFSITTAAPIALLFTTQPDSTPAGGLIAPALQVRAVDAFGNYVQTFTGNVTVAIAANPGGGTLSGTTTLAAVSGVASFNDLSIDRTGTGYELEASTTGLQKDTSNAFTITGGAATTLLFSVQPSNATAGAAINPAVRVTALDALGNVATTFTGNVTVAITAGTGTAGAVLSGTTTVAAIKGVAIFNVTPLSINLAGPAYTLTATAAGVTSATSNTFNIN